MKRRPCHIRRGFDDMRCGRKLEPIVAGTTGLAFCWDSGVPHWPRAGFCRSCLRSYQAAGNPSGVVASLRTEKHRQRMYRMIHGPNAPPLPPRRASTGARP